MVRLVFRPYPQIWRSICTSEPLRASTRVSSGFTLFRHSSPSFGSQHTCSYSNPSLKIRIGRWCSGKGSHLHSLSLRVWVCHPNTRKHVRLLGPCFKTGRLKPFHQHPKREKVGTFALRRAAFLGPINRIQSETITHPKMPHFSNLYPTNKTDAGLQRYGVHSSELKLNRITHVWLQSFPFQQFHVLLTLFPKCFSSFPHGTCLLSVSRQYLALDGIYHPIWAAFPNNSTLRECITKHRDPCHERGCHPLWRCVPTDSYMDRHRKHFLRLQFGYWKYQISKLSFSHFTRRY